MKEIPLTQNKFAIVDDKYYAYLSKFKWHLDGNGYASRTYKDGTEKKEFKMHREIIMPPKGMCVDHINGDTLDNRKINLRVVTHTQNTQNAKRRKDNTSGYRGVYPLKSKNKYGTSLTWVASIQSNKKRLHLGVFDTPEEACTAYKKKSKELHGEYGRPDNISSEISATPLRRCTYCNKKFASRGGRSIHEVRCKKNPNHIYWINRGVQRNPTGIN